MKIVVKKCVIAILLLGLMACSYPSLGETKRPATPNILWLVVEDMSPAIPAYGDRTISEATEPTAWRIYQAPISLPHGTELEVLVHRIGYRESAIKTYGVAP